MSADMLPPQVETDNMRALRPRIYHYLDPFVSGTHKNVSVYRGLIVGFARSWAIQALYLIFTAIAIFASPVGLNRLLSYIETKGVDAFIQPWVWILVIALAPLVRNASEQLYLYYNSRTATQIEALITAVVYEHSLRIRVLNKAADDTPPTPPTTPPETPKAGTALGPTQAPGSGEQLASEVSTLHSRGGTSISTTSTVVGPSNGKDVNGKSKDSKAKADEDKRKKEKSQDIIGRLNNLVTSDLDNISGGKDWLLVIVNNVLQLSLGSWFLYSILGWRCDSLRVVHVIRADSCITAPGLV
jgi:hypothetical protein